MGRAGADILRGGDDDDAVFGGDDDDALFGDDGNDFVRGDTGNDWIIGGTGNDRLVGNSGDDVISGGDDNDDIFGGTGNDILSGGSGENHISGGDGADYFVITSADHTIIEDFNASDGDRVTFLGQFENAEELAEHINITNAVGNGPGDLIVTGEDGTRTIFVGAAEQREQLVNSVVDFSEAGQNSISLANSLNEMNPGEIGIYVDSLDTDGLSEQFGTVDSVILFSNLHAEAGAELLNSFEQEELTDFLSTMGDEGLMLALGEMSPEELFEFLDGVDKNVASELITELGSETISAAILGMEYVEQVAVEEKFFPRAEEEITEPSAFKESVASISIEEDLSVPTIPEAEAYGAQDGEEEEASEDGTISADCFVATVAYESGEHPDVWLLRWYRDTVMRRSILGRTAIIIYWYLGPKLAEWVSGKPTTQKLFRRAIEAIVLLISSKYSRVPGRQPDQPHLFDSRKINLRNGFSSP